MTIIEVYISKKTGTHTANDQSLRELVKEVVTEELPNFVIKKKYLDVVLFDEPAWLEWFPANKVANYSYKAISNMGTDRSLLGLRQLYITKALRRNKEKIRDVIKHELVHIHVDPDYKNRAHPHGRKFQEHAERSEITGGHQHAEAYVNDRLWDLLTKGKSGPTQAERRAKLRKAQDVVNRCNRNKSQRSK